MKLNGKQMRKIHGGLVLVWIGLWIAATIFGWLSSVTFVSHMSMIALVLASASAWTAARTEDKQDRD